MSNKRKKPFTKQEITSVVEVQSVETETVEEVLEDILEVGAVETNETVVSSELKILCESNHQMSIFNQFIYHVRNKNSDIVIQNLGYGDVYVSNENNASIGKQDQRILFKESKKFTGVEVLFFISASQPVVSIIEMG